MTNGNNHMRNLPINEVQGRYCWDNATILVTREGGWIINPSLEDIETTPGTLLHIDFGARNLQIDPNP